MAAIFDKFSSRIKNHRRCSSASSELNGERREKRCVRNKEVQYEKDSILSPTCADFGSGVLELLNDDQIQFCGASKEQNNDKIKMVSSQDCGPFLDKEGELKQSASGNASSAADQQDEEGDLGCPSRSFGWQPIKKSRIVRTLHETLQDPTALSYFIQFMESKNMLHLLKFWLDAESFRVSLNATLLPHSNIKSKNSTDCPTHYLSSNDVVSQSIKQDAGALFARYIGKDALCNVGVTDTVRNSVINRICTEDGTVEAECFRPAQDFVLQIIEHRYFLEFLTSVYHCKHQIDVFTNGRVQLADILHNDTTLSYFMEFLDRHNDRSLVEFWISAESFRQDLLRRKCPDASQSQNDAMVLYDKYFSMQASDNLHFGKEIRVELELNICRGEEDGGPLPNCFEKAQKMAVALMDQKYLKPFLHSHLFRKYLSELIHTIETTLELPSVGKTRKFGGSMTTSSDRSSDYSFTFDNNEKCSNVRDSSLLRKGQRNMNSKISPTLASSSNETLNSADGNNSSLSEPEVLWKRKEKKAPLAEVDNMGRYYRGYNDKYVPKELPMTKGQKLKYKIDHALHRVDSKEKLMANEIAQLIINDVQKMIDDGKGQQ